MAISTITSKGQLTLPKPIRDYLHIETGDKVEFIIDEEGRVVMLPKTLRVTDIYGLITKKKGITVEKMNKAITNRIRRDNLSDESN